MRIIVDLFGGDKAPLEILKGCAMAVQEYGAEILACGNEGVIREIARRNGISLEHIRLTDVDKVITNEIDSTEVVKSYDDCTMAVGLKMLAGSEGDAFVSAGPTGALVVGASLFVKRIKGIKRAALATLIPCKDGCYMLLDIGANSECRPEMLMQFGLMGSIYMSNVMSVASPRVGMLNIGAEASKGNELQIEANKLLEKAPVNFIGNVEARYLPFKCCDVAVCDGFTGNVALKLTEGLGKWFGGELAAIFKQNLKANVGYLCVKQGVAQFRSRMDYKEYGGAPLMGTTKPVIKAHGSSDARAIKNAIRQAMDYAKKGVNSKIESALAQMKTKES